MKKKRSSLFTDAVVTFVIVLAIASFIARNVEKVLYLTIVLAAVVLIIAIAWPAMLATWWFQLLLLLMLPGSVLWLLTGISWVKERNALKQQEV